MGIDPLFKESYNEGLFVRYSSGSLIYFFLAVQYNYLSNAPFPKSYNPLAESPNISPASIALFKSGYKATPTNSPNTVESKGKNLLGIGNAFLSTSTKPTSNGVNNTTEDRRALIISCVTGFVIVTHLPPLFFFQFFNLFI